MEYQRSELDQIDWNQRLIGIKGARGVGKTTMLLQHIKKRHHLSPDALYLALDDIYFSDNRLIDLAEMFRRQGGRYLYLDEVHKYPDWSREVKNLYDLYPDLSIVFTGSSMLNILDATADLSRRAIVYHLAGLSFRQYLAIKNEITLKTAGLDQILHHANDIIGSLPGNFKPYEHLGNYLRSGYYPFFLEGESWYNERVHAMVKAVVETDLVFTRQVDVGKVRSIYQLLYAIASSAPFKPNVSKLAERLQISRNSVLQYFHYLENASLIHLLSTSGQGISVLQKPAKVYLENSNLLYVIHPESPNTGTVRETFVLNQLLRSYQVHYPDTGDFLVDGKYLLEVGGKNKGNRQVRGGESAWIIADNLDFAVGNKIPLWLMGLLY
jgi:predicted AAA+ superfamily ATPase